MEMTGRLYNTPKFKKAPLAPNNNRKHTSHARARLFCSPSDKPSAMTPGLQPSTLTAHVTTSSAQIFAHALLIFFHHCAPTQKKKCHRSLVFLPFHQQLHNVCLPLKPVKRLCRSHQCIARCLRAKVLIYYRPIVEFPVSLPHCKIFQVSRPPAFPSTNRPSTTYTLQSR